VATQIAGRAIREGRAIARGERPPSAASVKRWFQFGELLDRRIAAREVIVGNSIHRHDQIRKEAAIPRRDCPLMGAGPDHSDRKGKDQMTDNRQSPLAAPSASGITLQTRGARDSLILSHRLYPKTLTTDTGELSRDETNPGGEVPTILEL
jgi:hypothetical protein